MQQTNSKLEAAGHVFMTLNTYSVTLTSCLPPDCEEVRAEIAKARMLVLQRKQQLNSAKNSTR